MFLMFVYKFNKFIIFSIDLLHDQSLPYIDIGEKTRNVALLGRCLAT